jgi:hypothetical protein
MPREAGVVLVVVLVLVAHEVYLAWSLARTRVRLLSLERFVRADRERLAAMEQAPALVTTPAPSPAAAQVSGVTELDDDDACTKVWSGPPAALVEAAARGANPPSQATPRAALAMDVAPRAVSSPPPLSRAAQLAAGLERPKNTRTPPHAPPVRVRTETLAGMPASLPPAGTAPVVAVPRFAPTLVSMQAQSAAPHERPTPRDAVAVGTRAAPRPSDDDGETTSALASDPPMYAARLALSAPTRAPLADPDLIGSEDQAEEAARHRLGADEPTPRQARVKVEA